ncbi:MAG: nucleotidyl transferase AbiEii/AbiGii toxin family protein, partial [Polyangiaceae bacterium]|nr:nucleotidyl transferase AbiEii/AbiGii toxin family protein [Polyangiaceae bacterium]
FPGYLDTARVSMQIDVGFGDRVVPGPVLVDYPTILDLPAPRIRGYTRESVIAEKFHAMVRRGLANSRLRDFFDVWTLARQFDFDGGVLAAAVRETFARRGLPATFRSVALTEEFAADRAKVAQWRGFLRKSRLQRAPAELAEVVAAIAAFLEPVAEALHAGRVFEGRWRAPGPWSHE